MAVSLYDDALVKKLKKWTEKTQIEIYSPEQTRRLFEVIADKQDDKPIKLPIVAISRVGGYTIQNTNKTPTSYDGYTLSADEEGGIQQNVIPISIQYRVDVYTRYLKEADSFMRELVFNLINHPTLQVVTPYNGIEIPRNATCRISDDIEDNSDIPERLIPGQFSRMTLYITIDDAYLFDTRVRNNVSISLDGLNLEIQSSEKDVIVETID